jgi:carbonic anhydrase
MATPIEKLFQNNKDWVQSKLEVHPDYFFKLSQRQTPDFLWIGCADSRVPANEITGTESGEIFVHRNIANLVVHTDLNMLSVLQYAVEVLKVKHIIVCGHYGCGGILAAMTHTDNGLVNKWLRNIKEVYQKYYHELEAISDGILRANRLVELNIIEQVKNLSKTSIVQKKLKNHSLKVHGLVYGIADGILKDLNCTISDISEIEDIFKYDVESETEFH